jgi:hypothetical protein
LIVKSDVRLPDSGVPDFYRLRAIQRSRMTALAAPHRTFTPAVEQEQFPVLPPGVSSVAGLTGILSIARMQERFTGHAVRHLIDTGIGFYRPRQQVQSVYAHGVKRRTRAFMPGVLIIANGHEGKEILADFGGFFDGRFYGFVGLNDNPLCQAKLRGELLKVEDALDKDPHLIAYEGLAKGVKVRVTAGRWQGFEGVIDETLKRSFVVNLETLGRKVPFDIPGDLLERIG